MTPMTDADWASLKVLKREGQLFNWGDPHKIAKELVTELDTALHDLGTTAVITAGTGGKHVSGSYHYPTESRPGCAVDLILPKYTLRTLPDVLFHFLRYRFNGVGIYAAWRLSQGGAAIGGFHLDIREVPRKALWLCPAGQQYLPLTQANIVRWFK